MVDDEFLQNHYFMYFEYDTDTASGCTSLLLSEKFTITKILNQKLSLDDIEEYVESISKSVVVWFNIKNPEYKYPNSNFNLDNDIAYWLVKLNRLPFPAFNTCLMALMVKEVSKGNILKVIKLMEKYTFLVFKISQHKGGTGKNVFYRMAGEIYHERTNFNKFTNELIANTQKWTIEPMKGFKTKIDQLFTNNNGGFSAWDALRYFLFEYELFLQNQSEKIRWEDFKELEHIFSSPAMPSWQSTFGNYPPNKQTKLCHSLGNLLYVNRTTKPIATADFKGKKLDNTNLKIAKGYTISSASYSEIEVANNQDWTETEILARGVKMLTFMEERWGITIGDDATKKEYYFYNQSYFCS